MCVNVYVREKLTRPRITPVGLHTNVQAKKTKKIIITALKDDPGGLRHERIRRGAECRALAQFLKRQRHRSFGILRHYRHSISRICKLSGVLTSPRRGMAQILKSRRSACLVYYGAI